MIINHTIRRGERGETVEYSPEKEEMTVYNYSWNKSENIRKLIQAALSWAISKIVYDGSD